VTGKLRHLMLVGLISGALMACGADTIRAGDPGPGVERALAEQRAEDISDVHYALDITVPAALDEPVTGSVDIRFTRNNSSRPLVLDFRAPPQNVLDVRLNGEPVVFTTPMDHIVIPEEWIGDGEQLVSVDFRSTDAALNRQGDFMYSLFVPDHASTVFPVFEQPDIKARFALTLTVPDHWQALSNGAQLSRTPVDTGTEPDGLLHRLQFADTERISTYLFAFAAGELMVETAQHNGRTLTLYHRETDADSLQRNRDAIFDLHGQALAWMEDYTGIEYPFDDFEFFAIPAFQFGGMEHPGAIWYRAESLFLDPTASRAQELGRASLIAHETAHMWFGNLVTMRWFNDVWMKEVFANFMAAKIAGPSFPDLDLSLRFFQTHHPAAYAVDRTAGANPIRQPLENLRDAGSLYGAIIYQKAPIVMQQLEILIGEDVLRRGIQQYLQDYRFDNATWPDLIDILDARTPLDLAHWSEVWVNAPGRPRVKAQWTDDGIRITQQDDWPFRDLLWQQALSVLVSIDGQIQTYEIELDTDETILPLTPGSAQVESAQAPDFILPGVDGISYARFELDDTSRSALLHAVHDLPDALQRAVTWHTLREELLDGALPVQDLLDALLLALPRERDELLIQQLLGLLRNTWWRYLPHEDRLRQASVLEDILWNALLEAETSSLKGAWFAALMDVTLSEDGTARLYDIWQGRDVPEGLALQEQQFITLAEALAIRGVEPGAQILDQQLQRTVNADRRARLSFLLPALSDDANEREALFNSFADASNRRRESWVLDAVRAIHHPLRTEQSAHLIRSALELLPEIQQTGDIFFPLRWLDAVLAGHSSAEAARTVREYLADTPTLPQHLQEKVLQAADDLFRVSE